MFLKKLLLLPTAALATCLLAVCALASSRQILIPAAPGDKPSTAKKAGSSHSPSTLAVALSDADGFRQKGDNAIVALHKGTYYLSGPITLSPADSPDGSLILGAVGANGTNRIDPLKHGVVFSGGRPLRLDWQPAAGKAGVFQAVVPDDVKYFDQLFVNDEPQILARFPNFDPAAKHFNGTSADATSPARVARWRDPAGAFVHALHRAHWGDFHYRVLGKNADGKTLHLEGGWQNNRPEAGPHNSLRFVEGVFEELDAPREWFFDNKTRTLYYYPPAALDLAAATIVVPQLETLVRIVGTAGKPVRNVSLRGIVFKHTLRTFMKTNEPLQRGDWRVWRGGAVVFENAEDCEVSDCAFDGVGGNAVLVNNRNRRVGVARCLVRDAGASGVLFLGDPAAARSALFHYGKTLPPEKLDTTPGPIGDNFPQDCYVRDSLFLRVGRVEKQTAGVNIDLSKNITVEHCTIASVPRAGINIGAGTWGGHTIRDSDIFDTVRETGDHGSFNSWGRDRFWRPDIRATDAVVAARPGIQFWDAATPTLLLHNRWRCDHGWDIDLDDGSTNYIIRDNLCLNGGIKLREGYGRVVENNIVVNNSFHPHVWYRDSGDIVRRNIFFRRYAPIAMRAPTWGKEVDANFLHDPKAASGVTRPADELRRQSRQDEKSLSGNALFAAPAAGDYRVAAGSPAEKVGFKNFAMDDFGVSAPWLRALAPKVKLPAVAGGATAGGATAAKSVRDGAVLVWRGAQLKNIVGLGEVSAAGLPEETGVFVVSDAEKSVFLKSYGVRDGDVLIGWGKTPVSDLRTLREAAQRDPAPAVLKVWRNQQPAELKQR
ncbi:MAG: right-handed parallel beta-helix repeat-containing protein [Puniceicoccales bacterium]|jgi:hypothetical protein|nr:right-handed parallel beta-helix repeat-containing protein [Puniceicoccales bacterium]